VLAPENFEVIHHIAGSLYENYVTKGVGRSLTLPEVNLIATLKMKEVFPMSELSELPLEVSEEEDKQGEGD
jgi:hypothetical protein